MAGSITPGSLWGEEGMHDPVLLSILKSCGKIQPFFEYIFSFLSRRTDFYIIMEQEQAEMGFPPGVALNMVIQAFKKYEVLTRKREAELLREAETRRIDLMTDDLSEQPTIDVPSSAVEHLSSLSKSKIGGPKGVNQEATSTPSVTSNCPPIPRVKEKVLGFNCESIPDNSELSDSVDISPTVKEVASGPDCASLLPVNSKSVTSTSPSHAPSQEPASVEVPNALPLSSSVKEPSKASDTYNGSNAGNYVWSQTMTDVDIRVPVSHGTTGKDLKIEIRNDSLRVEVLKPERKVLLGGQLLNRIKVEESMWSLDKDASMVHINVEKNKEIMWKSVFEGEDGIDLTKVDTSRDISEFDQEAQAAIQKVTYDHHMKMLGKPTSNEKRAHDILKKAWDAPGSPFKGTPFDPSRVNIAGVW